MDSRSFLSSHYSLKKGDCVRDYVIVRLLAVEEESFLYLVQKKGSDKLLTLKEHFLASLCQRKEGNQEIFCAPEDLPEYEKSLVHFDLLSHKLGKITHPGVPVLLHIFPENNSFYRVALYRSGYALSTLLKKRDQISWFFEYEELYSFLWCSLDTLRVLHDQGFIHGQLDPTHVMLTKIYNPLFLHLGAPPASLSSLEKSPYVAPEQKISPWPLPSPATDLFSLGALLFHCITGHAPDFEQEGGSSLLLWAKKQKKQPYPRPFLEDIDKALSSKPSQRWKNAQEWQSSLVKKSKLECPYWREGENPVQKSSWAHKLRYFFLFFFLLLLGLGSWAYLEWTTLVQNPPLEPIEQNVYLFNTSQSKDKETRRLWGFSFVLKDYGFGLSPQSLPAQVALSSLSLQKGAPPTQTPVTAGKGEIYAYLCNQEGEILARSKKAYSWAFLSEDKKNITYEFKPAVHLDTQTPYQVLFATEKGALECVDVSGSPHNPLVHPEALSLLPLQEKEKRFFPAVSLKAEPSEQSRPTPVSSLLPLLSYASPLNWCLHPGVQVSQSSTEEHFGAHRAIDGQMGGSPGALTQIAASSSPKRAWWLISFGEGTERPVEKVIIHNLADPHSLEAKRLSEFKITLFDRLGKALISQDFFMKKGTWLQEDLLTWTLPKVVQAHALRVEKLGAGAAHDSALYLDEIEILAPEPQRQALKTLTAQKSAQNHQAPPLNLCQQSGVLTQQSSHKRGWVATYGSNRAIDGLLDDKYYAQTEENNELGFWEIDLGEARTARHIILRNKPTLSRESLRLSALKITLWDSSGNLLATHQVATQVGDYIHSSYLWSLPSPLKVKRMKIEKISRGSHPQDNALLLDEVEIF